MTYNNCQLELDLNRRVLYVHDKNFGRTVIRISNLREPITFEDGVPTLIDIRVPDTMARKIMKSDSEILKSFVDDYFDQQYGENSGEKHPNHEEILRIKHAFLAGFAIALEKNKRDLRKLEDKLEELFETFQKES